MDCILNAVTCQTWFSTGVKSTGCPVSPPVWIPASPLLEIWSWAHHFLLLNLFSNLRNEEDGSRWDYACGVTCAVGHARTQGQLAAALLFGFPLWSPCISETSFPLSTFIAWTSPSRTDCCLIMKMFPWVAITHLCFIFTFAFCGNRSIAKERNTCPSSKSVRYTWHGWVRDFEKDYIAISH